MIEMLLGAYGLYKEGKVMQMNASSGPFEITPEREAELVQRGLARYVSPKAAPELSDLPEEITGIPMFSKDTKMDELREIAKTMGLSFKGGTSKADMVAAMKAHIEENSVVGYDAEEIMEDGEDAPPAFDAAEAVQ